MKMDSLDQTVLLTSVEEEFNMVFEDRVFDNLKNLEDVIRYILSDSMVI
jgi:acyl carrier protein